MPVISEFNGIEIRMYYDDLSPPHFHAEYAEFRAKVAIADATIIAGTPPGRQQRVVSSWATEHRVELAADWELCQRYERPNPIAPAR